MDKNDNFKNNAYNNVKRKKRESERKTFEILGNNKFAFHLSFRHQRVIK